MPSSFAHAALCPGYRRQGRGRVGCGSRNAQTVPRPSPSATPSDPCGGHSRLLATANRPTIGYSACAVKRDTVVFELGYQNEVQGTPHNGSVEGASAAGLYAYRRRRSL